MRWTVPESREMGCLGAFGGRAVVGVMGKADKQEMAGGGGCRAGGGGGGEEDKGEASECVC